MQRGTLIVATGILLLAAWLRIAGLSFGNPVPEYNASYEQVEMLNPQTPLHPDSFLFVAHPLRMLLSGQLKNGFYENPSLLINLNLAVYAMTGEGNRLTHEERETDNLRQYAPFRLYFMVRSFSVLGGILLVAAAFATGKLLLNDRVGVVAGLLSAVAFPLVQHSHYATTSNLAAAFTMLSLLFALRGLKHMQAHPLLLSGIFAGLAMGTRYNAAVISLVLLLVGLWMLWKKQIWQERIIVLVAFALFPLTFLLTTPAAVLDTAEFLGDLRYISNQYLGGTGVSPWEGLRQEWLYLAVFGLGLPATLMLFTGMLIPFFERDRSYFLRAAVGLISLYFLVYSYLVLRTVRPAGADQLLLPIIAPLLVLSALGITQLLRSRWLWFGGVCVLMAFPLVYSMQFVAQLQQPDTREEMQAWVYENIPSGSSILLVGPYNVALDPEIYEWDQDFNVSVEVAELSQYDYAILSDALPHARYRSGVDVADVDSNLSQYTQAKSIDRPVWAGYDWALHTASYWHNPSLYLYCLNPTACEQLTRDAS